MNLLPQNPLPFLHPTLHLQPQRVLPLKAEQKAFLGVFLDVVVLRHRPSDA